MDSLNKKVFRNEEQRSGAESLMHDLYCYLIN